MRATILVVSFAVLAAAVALSGCNRSTRTGINADTSSDTGASSNTAANWTTLGTRAKTSQPGTSIRSNGGARWVDYNPPALYPSMVSKPTQFITMPDGTKLAAYVTLPANSSGTAVTERLPTLLMQTAYNAGIPSATASTQHTADPYLVEHGYAVVIVDVRGTGQSEGSWQAFGSDEQSDYYNVVSWIAQQPFSNGSVGLYGESYMGITVIFAAAQNHPAVKAAFSQYAVGDSYRDIVFTGGQMNPTFVPAWLAVVTAFGLVDTELLNDPQVGAATLADHVASALTEYQAPFIMNGLTGEPSTAYDSAFWAVRSPLEHDANINVPTFIVGGLHDLFQRASPLHFEEIKTRVPSKLLIGPWLHQQGAEGVGLPVDGVPLMNHIQLQWFDQYVKGMPSGADKLPNVTQYVSGYGHYVTATDWPNPQVLAQRLYLHGDKSLSSAGPAAGETNNQVVQEPINGICSISLMQWTMGLVIVPAPCFTDDNTAETLDVKYETAPMAEAMYINGPIEADVWMSTTAADAGLSVRVDDVDSSGNATALTNGIQTASLRAVDGTRSRTMNGQMIQPWHPYTQASVEPLTPNTPVLVPVEIFPTSTLIAAGHRLRVAVGASDLPQGVPPIPTLSQSSLGLLTIYSDAARPSSVVIPVVPASALN